MRVALIDTDILIYKAAFAAEESIEWDEDTWTTSADLPNAKQRFRNDLQDIIEETKADRFVLALSDTENWRKKILPSYKEFRSKNRKPILINPLKEWVKERYEKEHQLIPGLEGDDVMGIRATCGKPHTYIMCSIDKDMKTVPGVHYNFDKGEEFTVSPEEAEMYHMMQTLTGDVTDGYKGLPGCGPAKATKILERSTGQSLWEKVVTAYEKAELTEADALVQARVAFILQSNFFNQKTQKPILWTPPSRKQTKRKKSQ